VVIRQREVWWAGLPEPSGSEAGFRRPVVVVQGDRFNRSRIGTIICIPLTSQLRLGEAPGNVLLKARSTGLPRDSIANVSQVLAVDRQQLHERAGLITERELQQLFVGIDTVLGRI
jgi:mRNA interferase MazF